MSETLPSRPGDPSIGATRSCSRSLAKSALIELRKPMVHPRLARLDRHPSSGKQIVDPLLFLGREGRKIAPKDLPEVDPVGVLKVRDICIHHRDGRGRLSRSRGLFPWARDICGRVRPGPAVLCPSTIFVVGDVVAPSSRTLRNGDVGHEVVMHGTVPIDLTVRCDKDISGPDLDDPLAA